MEKSYSASYAAAGVDITAGYKAVELMKQHVARTMTSGCIGGLGGFGGLFELDCTDMPHPVLVSGTDGVGTKLKIAFLMDKHDTVGIDCVAMCVNDVICAGAKPLIFLDYIACGKNVPEKIADIVKGVAEGCVQSGAALIGAKCGDTVTVRYYKAVHKRNGRYMSGWDGKTEYHVGEWVEAETDGEPDRVAVKGLHVASLEFAVNYGKGWKDAAILEVETDIHDVIVPDAKD